MYKLLIVDDEELVRRSIARIVDWSAIGFSPVLQAENGLEALQMARTEKPDLILADIKMPFMSGLELAEAVRAELPDTKVVIMSGHDEFRLAQKAIEVGVLDYILKPLGAASLSKKMETVRDSLDDRLKEKQYLQRTRSQLLQSMPLLREHFLNTLVCMEGAVQNVAARLRFLECPLGDGPYAVCVIEPDMAEVATDEVELYTFAMKNIAAESVGAPHPVFTDSNGRIIVVFCLSVLEGQQDARSLLFEILDVIQNSIEIFIDTSATFAVGTTVAEISALHESYQKALAALECKYTLGKGRIYDIYDLKYREGEFIYPFEPFSSFMTHIKSWQISLLEQDLNAICEELLQRNASPANIKLVFIQLITEVLKLIFETHDASTDLWATGMALYKNMERLKTIGEIRSMVLDFAKDSAKSLAESRTSSTMALVQKAMAFVQEHFAEPELSLDMAAVHVSVSSGYLSALFKKETAVNFTDYLVKTRMEKAMSLLLTTDMKSYEVAYQVGYANSHYFSISFKKFTGKTPSEFKDTTEATHAERT